MHFLHCHVLRKLEKLNGARCIMSINWSKACGMSSFTLKLLWMRGVLCTHKAGTPAFFDLFIVLLVNFQRYLWTQKDRESVGFPYMRDDCVACTEANDRKIVGNLWSFSSVGRIYMWQLLESLTTERCTLNKVAEITLSYILCTPGWTG